MPKHLDARALEFASVDATLTFDGAAREVRGTATVVAKILDDGPPYFDLYVPGCSTPAVRDQNVVRAFVDKNRHGEFGPGAATAWVLPALEERGGQEVTLEFEWTVPCWQEIVFTKTDAGTVAAFKFRFSDRSAGGFVERYLPASCDWVKGCDLTLKLRTTDGTSFGDHVVTNGMRSSEDPWEITWNDVRPGDPYLHVESAHVRRRRVEVTEVGETVIVYSCDADTDFDCAARIIGEELPPLKSKFGDMPGLGLIHIHLVCGDEGMEYQRALVANVDNLRHELVHLWFGRGRWPRDADSAWLDEAVATWWARKPPRRVTVPTPAQVKRLRARPRARRTPPAAYFVGARLLHATAKVLGSAELNDLLGVFLKRGTDAYVATGFADHVLKELDGGGTDNLRRCWEILAEEELPAISGRTRIKGAEAGAARAELWDGPIGFRHPDGEYEYVGYRTNIDVGPNQGTFEYWAMLSDSYLNTSEEEGPLVVKRLDDVVDFPPGLSEAQFRLRALEWLNDNRDEYSQLTTEDLRFEKLKLL